MSFSRRAGVSALVAAAALAAPVLAATPAQAAAPQISIDDLTVPDLAPGVPVTAQATLRLSGAVGHTVTVRYQTVDGTATAGQDYRAASGVATFVPGQTTARIALRVVSDGDALSPERFGVVLSGPVGGGIADPKGVVTLVDCFLICSG